MIKVDVITPVFNNVQFIERCINSAHVLDEVNSIIVVDDGSRDGTYELLNSLKPNYPKLRVVTHTGRVNRGIACSRNLGIGHSDSEWIAFLDSDDYYLKDRFSIVIQKLEKDSHLDGIYEPVINKVESEEGSKRFKTSDAQLNQTIIKIDSGLEAESMFERMYNGKGVVHLNGLTIKRELALKVGLFDETLRIVDDSVFRLKIAYVGNLVGGSEEPIAVRTIHDTNSEPNIRPYDLFMKHSVLLDFFLAKKASKKLRRVAIKKLVHYYLNFKSQESTLPAAAIVLFFAIKNPRICWSYL